MTRFYVNFVKKAELPAFSFNSGILKATFVVSSRSIVAILSVLFPALVSGQATYAPLDREYYHLIDRYEILSPGLARQFHSAVKPISRKAIALFADSIHLDSARLSSRDRFNLQYLKDDNWEWSDQAREQRPFLRHFYHRPAGLYTVRTGELMLQVNPVLYFGVGKSNVDEQLSINTRGATVRGTISDKVGFHTFFADNQVFSPSYVDDYISRTEAFPQEGYTKGFKNGGYDFITASGYITFSPVKCIDVQFGHDKNNIGDGYRTLILSDAMSNYTFLKINTKVWKVNYQNIFAQLNADVYYKNAMMPKKYMAFHHLSVDIGKHLTVGLFESVVFSRGDSGQGQYDINYLNPIIFYRSIEQQLGSEDNALLGMNWKLNFLRRFSFYGQVALDEFMLKHVKAMNGWWANKQGAQAGIKYINVAGIKNLDAQFEANAIRPYMYSHISKRQSYTHYNHPMAHPRGANLFEMLAVIRYQPLDRLRLCGKFFHTIYGDDGVGQNWGGDVLKSYVTRERELDNKIGQGDRMTINYASVTASWQMYHNMFLDLSPVVRIQESPVGSLNKKDLFVMAGFRWNVPQRLQEF